MRHGLASKNTGGQTDVPRMTRARKKDENTLCSGDPDMNVNMFMGHVGKVVSGEARMLQPR